MPESEWQVKSKIQAKSQISKQTVNQHRSHNKHKCSYLPLKPAFLIFASRIRSHIIPWKHWINIIRLISWMIRWIQP